MNQPMKYSMYRGDGLGLTVDVTLERNQLSDLEWKFMLRAMAKNIPEPDIAKIILWQRIGVVDLNSFFVVPPREPAKRSRIFGFGIWLSKSPNAGDPIGLTSWQVGIQFGFWSWLKAFGPPVGNVRNGN